MNDDDLGSFTTGTCRRLWEVLGANRQRHDGTDVVRFSVWAPRARSVSVVGDWNSWDPGAEPMGFDSGSGVWSCISARVTAGSRYKFAVIGVDGVLVLRADPMARAAELPPSNASVVAQSHHVWGDDTWCAGRASRSPTAGRLSIYEVHLGSWRHEPDARVDYADSATHLADYVTEMGFTHVELMPVAEHPYGGSWGYQVTGYYAPTARYGDPDGFRRFVDTMHQRGIGVILDWVPAHFPIDGWALANFDGASLFEDADPLVAQHPDWGTLVFDLSRPQVLNFLVSNARYWVEEFHVDGLRVDAVASMLYLDYSRDDGEWTPNIHGGREDLDAVAFLQATNEAVRTDYPGVMMIAEESTTWEGVSAPARKGGLGFTHKWNLGWMHDTLDYFSVPPAARSECHDVLSFSLSYAWDERFVLPLSHDEVVHEKRSMFEKMPGGDAAKAANLRALYAWMWAHPGAKLIFMGGEFGQRREWSDVRELDWDLLDQPEHLGIQCLVAMLNRCQADERALWADEFTDAGFRWVDGGDRAHSVYAFLRIDPTGAGRPVLCLASLGAQHLDAYRVGVPQGGRWQVLLDSSSTGPGWSSDQLADRTDGGRILAESVSWQGFASSIVIDLEPATVLWLAPVHVPSR